MHPVKCTGLIIAAVLLFGCAAEPRYQTLYRYHPPSDPAAYSCLQTCVQFLKTCHTECSDTYAICLEQIEPEAQSRHADALIRYEGEWDQYQRDLDRYDLNLSFGWGHYDDWYGQGWYDPAWPGRYRPNYYRPQPPIPPSYRDELGKLQAQNCDRDCGCQPKYDSCFLICGGKKIPERRCMVNCPPEAK